MFCHECDFLVGTGNFWVLVIMEGVEVVVCLDCATKQGFLMNGMVIHVD